MGFLTGSVVKNMPAHEGDVGLIHGLGRSPGGEYDNPLQHSCLGNSWTDELGGLESMGSIESIESDTT